MEAKVASDLEMIRRGTLFDPGALERRGWKLGCLEKIRGAKMLVESGHTGVQAAERNGDPYGRFGWIGLIKLQGTLALGELCGRTRKAQVIPPKYPLGIVRFERVGSGIERHGCKSKQSNENDTTNHGTRTPLASCG